jgi:hypothetical protein
MVGEAGVVRLVERPRRREATGGACARLFKPQELVRACVHSGILEATPETLRFRLLEMELGNRPRSWHVQVAALLLRISMHTTFGK